MKLGIQLHLSGLSLSNTVSILEIFGVERSRSTVHNWVHKADLQPEEGRQPTQVAVDETVVQIDDEQYWLYAAVETESNDSSIHGLRRLQTAILHSGFLLNSATNTTLMMRPSSSMGRIVSTPPAHDSASPTTFNAMVTETALKGYLER